MSAQSMLATTAPPQKELPSGERTPSAPQIPTSAAPKESPQGLAADLQKGESRLKRGLFFYDPNAVVVDSASVAAFNSTHDMPVDPDDFSDLPELIPGTPVRCRIRHCRVCRPIMPSIRRL
ncbi:hypothetical protein DFH09DRAFT_1380559 [Mycena vulgaris]|nr:hypothetical protein DFH09DRAFT_1380559 [Mycena vulgaris]